LPRSASSRIRSKNANRPRKPSSTKPTAAKICVAR
jgi:hypothetical protein